MIPETIDVRPFAPADAAAVSTLVRQVFDEHVAPSFEAEGIAEMHSYVAPECVAERAKTHQTLVAWEGTTPVGMVEVRDCDHVSMLFVRTSHMGRGIGTALITRAIKWCRDSDHRSMTVNSSLNARSFYERFGFEPAGEPQETHGFAFQPMEKRLIHESDC